MHEQEQFLDVIDRDEAQRRFQAALQLDPLGAETVPLAEALGRNLATPVHSPINVPAFDRSNVDGFAVQAADTFGASEERPRVLRLLSETLATAVIPQQELVAGSAVTIATGGMIPRGADAVVMIEHVDVSGGQLLVRRAVSAGANVSFAATDIVAGEVILLAGTRLTSRDTGVLAAVGLNSVSVWRRPRVGIISTGDELVAPGAPLPAGCIYDSNARILADALRELGAHPVDLGIVPDHVDALREVLHRGMAQCDMVLLSGGTSKGAGDVSYRVVAELRDPGMVAHGVALKPGKPICLAVSNGKPVVVLPGFPTSAIFTFHEFVAPIIRRWEGSGERSPQRLPARLAVKVNSEIGRTEYLLVGLVESAQSVPVTGDRRAYSAYPMGKGSGSVTAFSRADGFVTIERQQEMVEAGAEVEVQLIGSQLQLADLVVISSHCVGLDFLLENLDYSGYRTKFMAVGSTAGLEAAKRGECDVAGIHLLDPVSREYNRPFVTAELTLIRGYRRQQGILYRKEDPRFRGVSRGDMLTFIREDSRCVMVNRHQGSGTRILIDELLQDRRPRGYAVQPRSHHAVAAAVAQRRADWGVAIEYVAKQHDLGFLPLCEEQFDFVIPKARFERPPVQAFLRLLNKPEIRAELARRGCYSPDES